MFNIDFKESRFIALTGRKRMQSYLTKIEFAAAE